MEMTPAQLKKDVMAIVGGQDKRILGEVFKDNWCSKHPWRVQMPRGAYPCHTKREALRISDSLIGDK